MVLQNALFPGPKKKLDDLIVPWCTYTDPEIAHVGMYEHDAAEKGIAIDTYVHELSHVDRSRTDGHTDGFVKIHLKRGTDKILGVFIVGPNASELIAEAVIAVEFGGSAEDLARTCHAHPTLSEAVKEAALAVASRAIHS